MLHVRNFDTADALMAHYKDLKARQSKPRGPVPVPVRKSLCNYSYEYPIGPNMPPFIKKAHDRLNALKAMEFAFGVTKTKARLLVLDVCAEYEVTWNEFISARRNHYIILARRKAYWILKTETSWSLPQIGRFVNKDHTTVLHGIRRYELDLIHAEAGLSMASTREFRTYEKCGCRRDAYLKFREQGR